MTELFSNCQYVLESKSLLSLGALKRIGEQISTQAINDWWQDDILRSSVIAQVLNPPVDYGSSVTAQTNDFTMVDAWTTWGASKMLITPSIKITTHCNDVTMVDTC